MKADRETHEAARKLLDRQIAHINGTGPKPALEDVEAVKQMRLEAAELYRFAMDEIEEIAVRARYAGKD
jgi:hypothetical protein